MARRPAQARQGQALTPAAYSYDAAGNQTGNDGGGSGKPLSISYLPTNQTQSISDINQNPEAMTWAGAGQAERVKRAWTDQGTNYTATYVWSQLGLSGYTNNGINEPTQTSSVTSWIIRAPDGTPVAQRYSSGQEYYYLFDGQGNVIAMEDPGVIQASWDYCPTGNNPALPGAQPTTVGMANPIRQGGVPYDDPTKMYVGPNGAITPDYSGVGTQTPGFANGDAAQFAALVGPGGAESAKQRLIDTLRVLARRTEPGFDPFSTPVVIDVNVGDTKLAAELQTLGYNALPVGRFFGPGTKDPVIDAFAYQIRGWVLSHEGYNPSDPAEGFPLTGLVVPDRVRSAVGIARYLSQVLGFYPNE